QVFVLPPTPQQLTFTLSGFDLHATDGAPPDAFEVSLLDAETGHSFMAQAGGLATGDALLNIQPDGRVYFATGVTVPGASVSGDVASLSFPLTVTVDLHGVAGGSRAALTFDLAGFGARDSSVVLDSVDLPYQPTDTPFLTVQLDSAVDSGTIGDGITSYSHVALNGSSEPEQLVRLDLDGDGVDDATTFAGADGRFSFAGLSLPEGVQSLTLRATNSAGTTEVSKTLVIDSQKPTGSLVAPAPGAVTNVDLGYVEIQWTDVGAAGLNASTFGIGDITIAGVSIDRVEPQGGGRVRYVYNADGQTLPDGAVAVSLVAGQVGDVAANVNNAGSAGTFTLDRVRPTGALVAPMPGAVTNVDLGYVEVQWTDSGAAGMNSASFDVNDIRIAGVSIDRVEPQGAGRVRYVYNVDGQ
ncbi:MAG TPA: Ig-like domain-containing protein, partial [Pirellulaceae bacterium]|nr:Ig-like domain-containing protein [Pirellulaceae bacterium]